MVRGDGNMRILKTAKYKRAFPEEKRYKSDEDIAKEFSGMQIINIEVRPSGSSGWIELSFPDAGEHVGGGANEVTDSWIKYNHNGKIAFDNWYPPEIYQQLVSAIEDELQGHGTVGPKIGPAYPEPEDSMPHDGGPGEGGYYSADDYYR